MSVGEMIFYLKMVQLRLSKMTKGTKKCPKNSINGLVIANVYTGFANSKDFKKPSDLSRIIV